MLSGLPGRCAVAVFIGFIEAFLTMRAGAATGAGAAYAVAVVGCAYLSITIWHGVLSWLLFGTMQATVRPRSGMVCEQTRKASFMQRFCSSAVWAKAEADSTMVNAAASAIRFCMECPLRVQ